MRRQLFTWLSNLPPLAEAIPLARQAFPRRGRPQEWNLCLCHLTRKRVIGRAQKEKLRRERPRHYLSLDGEGLGQRTLYWPGTRHIACMAQTKQGIHNSMLLECVKWDSEHVTLRNVEGEGVRVHSQLLQSKPALGALFYDFFCSRKNHPGNYWFV